MLVLIRNNKECTTATYPLEIKSTLAARFYVLISFQIHIGLC